jgi:hypothetical protein
LAPLWARHLAPLWAKCLHGHNAHARASVTAPAHLPRASLLCSVAATHRGWRHHCSWLRCVPHSRGPHGESQCILTTRTIATDTTITRVLVIALANFPRASVFCSVAAAHSGWRQHCSRSRCVPPSRDPAARASASHRSRRLHAHNAHARASVIALTNFPRTSLLCHVAATHSGWRHHRSRPRCVPRNRDPHGESQCIPTVHAVSTRPTLMRVPL